MSTSPSLGKVHHLANKCGLLQIHLTRPNNKTTQPNKILINLNHENLGNQQLGNLGKILKLKHEFKHKIMIR